MASAPLIASPRSRGARNASRVVAELSPSDTDHCAHRDEQERQNECERRVQVEVEPPALDSSEAGRARIYAALGTRKGSRCSGSRNRIWEGEARGPCPGLPRDGFTAARWAGVSANRPQQAWRRRGPCEGAGRRNRADQAGVAAEGRQRRGAWRVYRPRRGRSPHVVAPASEHFSEPPQETGIRFSGSTNGMGTTVPVRGPDSLWTRTFEPAAASSTGTQQNPMFFLRRGE